MPNSSNPLPGRASRWYQQPIAWLGILVFVASVAGCIWIIVVGARYDDPKLDTAPTVFGVPATSSSTEAPAAGPRP